MFNPELVIALERGQIPVEQPAGIYLRIVAGSYLPCAEIPLLNFQLDDDAKAFLHKGSRIDDVPLAATAQGYCTREPCAGVYVFFGTLPWYQPPAIEPFIKKNTATVYIPWRGWRGDTWFDGPLFHAAADGFYSSFLPLGDPARLLVDPGATGQCSRQMLQPWFSDTEGVGKRRSLSQALLSKLGEGGGGFEVFGNDFDLREVLSIVLLRTAYPDAKIRLKNLAVDPRLQALWRRLCQNLGIAYGRVPLPLTHPQSVHLEDFEGLLPDFCLPTLGRQMNFASDVIPPSFLRQAAGGDCFGA